MSLGFLTTKHGAMIMKGIPMVISRKIPAVLCMIVVFAIFGAGLPDYGMADMYFNCGGTEPTINAAATTVMCDDFEDGAWYVTINDSNNPLNDGWFGANGNGLRNPPPPAATCTSGAGGTICTAISSPQGGDGGDAALGMHGFSPNNTAYNELWHRMYIKLLPGYTFNNNQKFYSYISSAFQGGIDYGGGPTRNLSQLYFSPQMDCLDDNYRNPQAGPNVWCYLPMNLGNAITLTTGKWYFVEWHIKLNDYNVRNGILELWVNDCGSNGLGCTGTPTKRMNYTNIGWKGNGTPNNLIGSFWLDIWGNPSDVGTMHIDQIVVAKAGPIGFKGASGGGDTTPPAAPANLRVQ